MTTYLVTITIDQVIEADTEDDARDQALQYDHFSLMGGADVSCEVSRADEDPQTAHHYSALAYGSKRCESVNLTGGHCARFTRVEIDGHPTCGHHIKQMERGQREFPS